MVEGNKHTHTYTHTHTACTNHMLKEMMTLLSVTYVAKYATF